MSEKTDEEKRKDILSQYHTPIEKYSGRYRSVSPDTYNNPEKDFTYKGGFYYDSQLEDPYLSVSLHANTYLSKDGEWKPWEGECLEPVRDESNSNDKEPNYSKCYGKEPIARCIMSEDFSYSIANNFSDYNGGNPIEDIFTNFKPYAPILGEFSQNLKKANDDVKNNNKNFGSDIVSFITGMGDKITKFMGAQSSYLNKALFVQGTRFSYYNGTSFNFNNMEMRFIAFSDYVTTDGKTWRFQSVEEYIKRLQPYVMGFYTPYNADFIDNLGLDTTDKDSIAYKTKEFIKQYVGFQDPPGGFEMSTKALNNTLKGTLRLNIGGTWAIENLVMKGMNVSMSKVQAKHPENPGETVPLYADITLQLAPAACIVDTSYRNIIEHKGMGELRKSVKSAYNKQIDNLKKTYKKPAQ